MNDSLPMEIGEVKGRVSALEDRQTRHEDWVGNKLNGMDTKIDQLLASQQRGATIGSFFRWAMMVAAGASGWVAMIWQGKQP